MIAWTHPPRTIAVAVVVAVLVAPAAHSPAPARVVRIAHMPAVIIAAADHTAAVVPAAPIPTVLAPFGVWLPVLVADARAYRLPPSLVEAVGLVESRGRTGEISSTGALGVLQIEPGTAAWLGLPVTTTAEQIRAGEAYLAYLVGYVGVSSSCLAAGPGGSAACAWSTDRVLSDYAAGPGGAWQGAYIRDVRGYWTQTKGAAA